MEVAAGIHRIETPFEGRVNAVYLFLGRKRSLLVDATTRACAGAVLDACNELGTPALSWVVNTHSDWDHVAGNGVLRAASSGTLFFCHELDRAMIEDVELMISGRYGEFADDYGFDETPEAKEKIRAGTAPTTIDISLRGGEWFDLGDGWRVEVVHTPGHSDGSISVYDPRSKAYVIGDAVLGRAVPFASGDPAFPPTYRFADDYLATIGALRAAAPSAIFTSHYPIYAGADVKAFLDESEEFAHDARRLLEHAISTAGEPVDMLSVAHALSARLGDWPAEAAPALVFPLTGHLEQLVATGKVVKQRGSADPVARYLWNA